MQSSEGENTTRWSMFQEFLNQWELANEDAPLLTKKQTATEEDGRPSASGYDSE